MQLCIVTSWAPFWTRSSESEMKKLLGVIVLQNVLVLRVLLCSVCFHVHPSSLHVFNLSAECLPLRYFTKLAA